MRIGLHEEWSPIEEPWNQDLEDMWTTQEQQERDMHPEIQENCHWMELALEDPLFQVSYTQIFGANLYVVDITQKPP